MGQVEVAVELTHDIAADEWARRHAAGEVPDRAPYGTDRLRGHGVSPYFPPPLRSSTARWVAARLRNRAQGLELGAAGRRGQAAVLCMDERTGLPAALRPGGPPVLTRAIWLTSADGLPGWYRTVAGAGLSRAAGVWTNVSSMVPILRREWGLRDVHLVPLGIDADFFAEQPWEAEPGLVVSAGEDRMRDHELLVAAVAAARRRVPTAHLELATTRPVDVGPELVTVHAERLGGRMRGLYARASVVALAVQPTPMGSGMTVVLEAMASGRAVVMTANPGIDDYVEHGVTGLLVPPGDVGAFADALVCLLADPDRAQEMGRAGRAAVEARWTSHHMAGHLAAVVRSVI